MTRHTQPQFSTGKRVGYRTSEAESFCLLVLVQVGGSRCPLGATCLGRLLLKSVNLRRLFA